MIKRNLTISCILVSWTEGRVSVCLESYEIRCLIMKSLEIVIRIMIVDLWSREKQSQ